MSDITVIEDIFIAKLINGGQQAGLEFLLKDIDLQAKAYKQSLLSIAIRHNCQDIISELLDGYGIDINGLDRQGKFPIIVAAQHGLEKTLRLLIDCYGADITLRDHKRWNVLCWAVKARQIAVVATLINHYDMAIDHVFYGRTNNREAIVNILQKRCYDYWMGGDLAVRRSLQPQY